MPPFAPLHVWRRRWLIRLAFYTFVVLVAVPLAFSQVLLRGAAQPPSAPPPGYVAGSVLSQGLRLRTWTRRGGAYTRRFTTPGAYRLQCSLHPTVMSQLLRVRASGSTSKPR